MKSEKRVRQAVSGNVEQVAGRDIHHRQVTEGNGVKIDVTVSGNNIHIGAVYAHSTLHIVIDTEAVKP